MRLIRILAVIVPAIALAACGGGSSGDARKSTQSSLPETTGTYLDSPVSGVAWRLTSTGESGLTDGSGEFPYTELAGTFVETVTFSIGDILLGTAPVATYITAVELTNSFSPTDRAATNQLVFLQSIDFDKDPTNGIMISEATREAAVGVFDSLDFDSLDFDSPDFDEQVVQVVAIIAPGNEVVSDTEALDHFYTTYAALGGTDTFDFLFPGYPPVGEDAEEFRLVFADEFDEGFELDGRDNDNAPNPDVWNIDQGYGPDNFGWGNDEWQLYTDSEENLRVEDGNLVITALCPVEPCKSRDDSITSARITTNDKREDFRYGKVVARIKPPVGQGTWPAFWALGKNFGDPPPEGLWPRVGEIDFMEVYNNTNNDSAESATAERTATSAIHWCDETDIPPTVNCFTAGGRRFIDNRLTLADSLGDDFQIWETDWTPDKITVSINGVKYYEQDINVTPVGDPRNMEEFRRDFFLLLNVAMGGTLGSGRFDSGLGRFVVDPPQGDETFPQTMLVDYVRVYERVDDISPPELTELTIASDNDDPSFATTGDVVTVSLTANEDIDTPVVTIAGGPANVTQGADATSWTASRALTSDDDEGVIEFLVEYVDLAGNDGVPASETTDSSSVTVDSIAPTLTTVTIESDNPNPGLATTGDTIEVTLAADEAIVPPVVTISGFAVIPVGSGANWTASRMVTATDPEGEVTFSIDYADFAGNSGATVSESTDSSSVIVSTTSATVTIVGAPATFNTLAPIPLSFEFSKPVTGFDLNDIEVTNGAAGNFAAVDGDTYTADVTPTGIGNLVIGVPAGAAADAAGGPSEAADDVVVTNDLDTDAPVLSVVSITSNNLNPGFARTGEEVTISLTASEDILEPVVTIAGGSANVTPGADATSWSTLR